MPISNKIGPTVHFELTELDAVNLMLSVIGEAPVNELQGELPVDAGIAHTILRETMADIQNEGWHFNRAENFPLALDVNGQIPLPINTIRVSLNDPDCRDVIQRGRRLYDRRNHTYVFKGPVNCTITQMLGYDEMPQTFRYYVAVAAARKFQDRVVGSGELHGYTEADEARARAKAVAEDIEVGRPSMAKGTAISFINGWTVGQTLRRDA